MKVTVINKSRKSPGNCVVCDAVIEQGAPYKYVQEYRGPKRSAHEGCSFRLSHVSGGRYAEVYAAQEDAQDEFEKLPAATDGDHDHTKALLENLRDRVDELASDAQEAADAIGEHFDGSENHQRAEELAGQLEDWSSAIGDVIDTIEDGFEPDRDDSDEDQDKAIAEWWEETFEAARGVIDDCPI